MCSYCTKDHAKIAFQCQSGMKNKTNEQFAYLKPSLGFELLGLFLAFFKK